LGIPAGNPAGGDLTEPRAGSRRPVGGGGTWARVEGLAEKGGGPAVCICTPTVICEVVAS